MTELDLTLEEAGTLEALGETIGIIGDLFVSGEATPSSLYMAVGVLRTGADVLEQAANRWEMAGA